MVSSSVPARFQPTLPARGATRAYREDYCGVQDFNPRSPHGERPSKSACAIVWHSFQPTLPARGATTHSIEKGLIKVFQPTLPARGATVAIRASMANLDLFQPTLPARGATAAANAADQSPPYFNPRSPHGERLTRVHRVSRATPISTHAPRTGSDCAKRRELATLARFQPTLPARGATRSASGLRRCR